MGSLNSKPASCNETTSPFGVSRSQTSTVTPGGSNEVLPPSPTDMVS